MKKSIWHVVVMSSFFTKPLVTGAGVDFFDALKLAKEEYGDNEVVTIEYDHDEDISD